MQRILTCMASAFALLGALADDVPWTYKSEDHETIAPAVAEGLMAGLDARERGFYDLVPVAVNRWFFTYDWTFGDVTFYDGGTYLIIK